MDWQAIFFFAAELALPAISAAVYPGGIPVFGRMKPRLTLFPPGGEICSGNRHSESHGKNVCVGKGRPEMRRGDLRSAVLAQVELRTRAALPGRKQWTIPDLPALPSHSFLLIRVDQES